MVLEVPYTGILGKNTSKTLIPHQRFSWIFDLRIYGGSDPIYGKKVIFDRKSGKNTVFKNFSLSAKFNRFFIILGGVAGGRRPGKPVGFKQLHKFVGSLIHVDRPCGERFGTVRLVLGYYMLYNYLISRF